MEQLSVCSYHVECAFQSESTHEMVVAVGSSPGAEQLRLNRSISIMSFIKDLQKKLNYPEHSKDVQMSTKGGKKTRKIIINALRSTKKKEQQKLQNVIKLKPREKGCKRKSQQNMNCIAS